jgi:hypothetical protein
MSSDPKVSEFLTRIALAQQYGIVIKLPAGEISQNLENDSLMPSKIVMEIVTKE